MYGQRSDMGKDKNDMKWISGLVVVLLVLVFGVGPGLLESAQNKVEPHSPYTISPQAQTLHDSLTVGDLHADSTLWNRNLLERATRGQVDVPRLREANVALQMFTAVTRSPRGQNYDANESDAPDNITALAILQAWPPATWSSLTARALYQADRLKGFAAEAPDQLQLITSQGGLEQLLARRESGEPVVGALLGTEGSHALDGDLEAIDTLFEAGFRMMGLQHFFDNRLGGSLHGQSGEGLTEFGRQAVERMLELGVMIDVAHSSEQVVRDVLARSEKPLIVSHTGFKGHCDSARNIPDELMRAIASEGGLIGVGF